MTERERPRRGAVDDDGPVLPRTSRDETAEGWSEPVGSTEADDDRYLSERPPHHDG